MKTKMLELLGNISPAVIDNCRQIKLQRTTLVMFSEHNEAMNKLLQKWSLKLTPTVAGYMVSETVVDSIHVRVIIEPKQIP